MTRRQATFEAPMLALALIAAVTLTATPAYAGGVALTLVRSTLVNVNDAAGRWQHEGGEILRNGTAVGQYAISRRITTGGTDRQNTAMTTVTLFFANTGAPPQNVTLAGAHSFSNGRFAGSVSGASNRYAWVQGADATIVPAASGTGTLTILWAGANQLTLP